MEVTHEIQQYTTVSSGSTCSRPFHGHISKRGFHKCVALFVSDSLVFLFWL